MKKTYLAPTMKVVPLRMRSHILQASLKTNSDLNYSGATDDSFDEDAMR